MLNAPRRIGVSLVANKVSDLLLSPKTTLPALLNMAGVPMFMTSLLVPIRESGALLPQMIFAKLLSNYPKRHRAWRLGMLIQVIATIIILLAGFGLSGFSAGIVILITLGVWSISRSLCSLTYKDIQGKHIDKGYRGRLIGSAATISSLMAVIVAVFAWYLNSTSGQFDTNKLIIIGGLSVLSQFICIAIMWPVNTELEIVNAGNSSENSTFLSFSISRGLKKFIVMRCFLSHSALLAPLFTLAYTGDVLSILSFLIIAQSLSSVLSSYAWGKLADISALMTMRLGAFVAVLASVTLLIITVYYEHVLHNPILILVLFFTLSVGHNGIRTGRKIYAVDIAEGQKRTEFVAVSNTFVGIFILLAGISYSILTLYSINLTLLSMTISLIAGGIMSFAVAHEK